VKTAAICCAILAIAAAFRTIELAARPMHADEAILADKFGTLLESGPYEYDPRDYHGPVLLYCTLPSAWIAGTGRYVDLSEPVIRVVPAVSGIALALMTLLLAPGLGRGAAIAAAVLTAIAPAMVFYSRYYIPEMLLVVFSFGVMVFGYRYAAGGGPVWAVLAGLSAGLMFATKETAVIAAASMLAGLAALPVFLSRNRQGVVWHIALAFAAAAAVIALLPGAWESIRSLPRYIGRGLDPQVHRHPWYFYLALVRSEALIFVLGAAALIPAFTKRGLLRFLAVYTLTMTVAYSLIPYKTPWCLLGFLHGWILLAGWSAAALLARMPRPIASIAAAAFAAVLGWQAYSASFAHFSDPANRYVYAHTGNDVFTLQQRVEQLAAVHPDGRNMRIQVVSGKNIWPLPWYLRTYPNVEWWTGAGAALKPAPVILASPEMEAALGDRIYAVPPEEREMYVAIFDGYTELRPSIELRGYARKSLWDRVSIERPQRRTPR
jgi:uncharacterized protein (TIGR03663 family)